MTINDGESRMQVLARKRMEALHEEADQLAGAARKLQLMLLQSLDSGQTVSVQPQVNYLTGSLARIQKDWGVVEMLAQQGFTHKKRTT
jgi:hypothetical protein